MPNPRLAGRYAKSLIDLATEQNQLETVYKDMQYLQSVCKSSPQFVNIMRSPVINAGKKQSILDALTKDKTSPLTASFNKLLVTKTREEFIPDIIEAFINQYNEIKGIHKVKLITAVELSEEMKEAVITKIKAETSLQQIELETTVKEELIGGFVLEFDNKLVDASIAKELREIKKQFRQNIYVHQIR